LLLKDNWDDNYVGAAMLSASENKAEKGPQANTPQEAAAQIEASFQ
jgi:hypothetical protein